MQVHSWMHGPYNIKQNFLYVFDNWRGGGGAGLNDK
jgi:hypothetical protein